MKQFKKLAKAFTTWKNSPKSSSESKPKKQHDDYTDAMAYLEERKREAEYNAAIRRITPSMTTATQANLAGQAAMWNSATTTGTGMGAINQAWAPQAASYPYEPNTQTFSVEKVDNGFIIRSGKYSKICKDMEELSSQFISIMVERQLDK